LHEEPGQILGLLRALASGHGSDLAFLLGLCRHLQYSGQPSQKSNS
jgi:hypothetical protein